MCDSVHSDIMPDKCSILPNQFCRYGICKDDGELGVSCICRAGYVYNEDRQSCDGKLLTNICN